MSRRFENQVVVVTGGASGIGRACVERFAAEGAKVAIWDFDAKAGAALAAELGASTRHWQVDVSSESSVANALAETVAAFGEVSHLVNSAGIQGAYVSVTKTTRDEWDRVLGVNLHGAFHCAKHVIPSIQRQGGGAVVNIASVNSFHCQKNTAAYATGKAALLGLTRSIAVDYAPNVRCTAVCPGAIETPMLDNALSGLDNVNEVLANLRALHLSARLGKSSEIAALVALICSDEGSFMTGQAIRIDGGLGITLGGNE